MSERLWSTKDGEFHYISLTPEYLEGALNVLRKGFYPYESACRAVGISQNPNAVAELDELTIRTARDGVSIIAIEKQSKKVIGVAFNKLQVKNNEESYFENYAKSCKYSSSRALVQFMQDADAFYDLFENLKVDCLLEIMFLATLPEYTRRGVGVSLCEASIQAAKSLLKGDNVKQPIDGTLLKLDPVPKLVAALFTSPNSQKIGRKLGFEIAAKIGYEKFTHEGKTFACVLGPEIPYTTLEYKRI